MKFSGELTVKAPRAKVYAAVRDARFFASCVDGVQDLQETAPDTYSAVFATKVAYMSFKFKVTVQVVRAEEPREIEAKVEGTPLGIVGRLTATSLTTLTEVGDETKINYEVEAALTGKLGSLGQPVLRTKAKEMERQFAARLAAAFATQADVLRSFPRKRRSSAGSRFRGTSGILFSAHERWTSTNVETDVLVIGSGAAGMYAAIEAARSGAKVLLADRSLIGRGGATVMAQMTVAAALGEEVPDDPSHHLDDTIAAGRGLCDEKLSQLLCEDAPECIRQLDKWGVGWARKNGHITATTAPGHDRPRCVYVDFINTGPAVSKTLRTVIARDGKSIRKAGDLCIVDLITSGAKPPAPSPGICRPARR